MLIYFLFIFLVVIFKMKVMLIYLPFATHHCWLEVFLKSHSSCGLNVSCILLRYIVTKEKWTFIPNIQLFIFQSLAIVIHFKVLPGEPALIFNGWAVHSVVVVCVSQLRTWTPRCPLRPALHPAPARTLTQTQCFLSARQLLPRPHQSLRPHLRLRGPERGAGPAASCCRPRVGCQNQTAMTST